MGGSGKRKKSVRYFSRAELKQLFTLDPAGLCRVRKEGRKEGPPDLVFLLDMMGNGYVC